MQTILSNKTTDSTSASSSNYTSTAPKINFDTLIENLLTSMLLLLPVFFLPFTVDVYVLNKSYLIILISVLVLLLFFLRGIQNKLVQVFTIDSYWGQIVLLIGAVLSAYFSQNKIASAFGTLGNYDVSLLIIFALVILSFVVANVRLNVRKLFNAFLIGVTLTTFISLLAYFGVVLPFAEYTFPEFTLVGSSNALFALQVLSLILAFYYIIAGFEKKGFNFKLLVVVSFVLNAFYLLLGLNLLAIGLTVVGIVFCAYSVPSGLKVKSARNILMPVVSVLVLLSFVSYFPVTRAFLGLDDYSKAVRLPVKESWVISASVITDSPFVGSGLGTFLNDYTFYRPTSLNATDAWNLRFNKPFNDYFLWLATAGLVGFISYVLFFVFALKRVLKLNRDNEINYILYLLTLLVFVEIILFGSDVIINALLFVLIGLTVRQAENTVLTIKGRNILYILPVLVFAFFVSLGFLSYKVYAGQIYFKQSLRSNNIVQRYQLQRSAIRIQPYESFYRRENIFTSLFIAKELSKKQDMNQTETKRVQQLIAQAINDSRALTQLVDPRSVQSWETMAIVYNSLVGVAKDADNFAIASYAQAVNLEKTSPRLWVNLGGVHYRRKDYMNAIQAFARSVQLKNDYANAHYNLAYALKDSGDVNNAVIQLEIVERLVPKSSDDYEKIQKDLKEFRELAEKADQATQTELPLEKQTPENVVTTPANQAPLTTPEEEGKYQISEDVSIPPEILKPDEDVESRGEGNQENEETPSATGSDIDKTQGEVEAPLAKPTEE